MAYLVWDSPQGRVVRRLDRSVLILGRDEVSDICLRDASVAPRHALVQVAGAKVSITDLGAGVPTRIMGAALTPELPSSLDPGDLILVGAVTLTFQLEAPPPEPVSPPRARAAPPAAAAPPAPPPGRRRRRPAPPPPVRASPPSPPAQAPPPPPPPPARREFPWLWLVLALAFVIVALLGALLAILLREKEAVSCGERERIEWTAPVAVARPSPDREPAPAREPAREPAAPGASK